MSNYLIGAFLGNVVGFRNFISSGSLNFHFFQGFVSSISFVFFNFTYNIHASDNFSENNMTTIQPWGLLHSDKKLRSVGIFSSVGHGQPSRSIMLQFEVLIREFSIRTQFWDGLSSSSISSGEITTLKHEIFGHSLSKKSDFYRSGVFTSDRNVEFYFMSDLRTISFSRFSLKRQKGKYEKCYSTAKKNLHGCFCDRVWKSTPRRRKEVLGECELGHDSPC